jgi:membrane-bound serine protease (ClpP class)
MNAIIILFLIGALLLAAEVFLPGIIAGVLGGLALLVGSILSFGEFGLWGGVIASVAAIGLVVLVLYLELVVLPKTAFGRKMVVQATVSATSQPPLASPESVVDQPAEALTTLAPSGYVLVGGRRYEAFCRSGHAAKGATLKVVGLDNFRLIVTQS